MGIYQNRYKTIDKKTGKERIKKSPFWSISWTDKKGKQHKEKTKVTSKEEAREILVEKLRQVKLSRHSFLKDDQKMTFAELAEKFEKEFQGLRRKRVKFSEASRKNYIVLMKKLVEHFGEIQLSEINESDVEEYKTKRQTETVRGLGKRKLTGYTINRELGTLRLALNWAVKNNIIMQNPVQGAITRETLFEEPARKITYSDDELNAVLTAAHGPWKTFFLVGANTGMRLEEILGLRWSEFNAKDAVIELPPERTKGGKGREVMLNKTMLELFKRMKMQRGESENEFIFPNPATGKPYSKCFSNTKKRILKRAGIKKQLRFHDLRRTFVTKALDAGVGVKSVQDQVGHADAATTLKNYAQPTKQGKKRAVAAVEVSEPVAELVELKKA